MRLLRALPLAVLCACSVNGDPPSVVPTAAPNPQPAAACYPTTSTGTAPLRDPNGPFFHQVAIARTTDGTVLSGARTVIDHGSVPDGVRLRNGDVLIYYVNGASGGATWVARLSGDSVQAIGPIVLHGVTAPTGVMDPDAVLLPDGRIRLAFYGGFGPPTSDQQRAMCIAESLDGISFSSRGAALTFPTTEPLTDPSLLALGDGNWLMAISRGQQTIIARSTDGVVYTRDTTLGFGGVPELALAPDGAVRLYVCAGGIVSYRSTDAGRSWTREGTVIGPGFNGRPIVCDPSLVAGAGWFVFKSG